MDDGNEEDSEVVMRLDVGLLGVVQAAAPGCCNFCCRVWEGVDQEQRSGSSF